MKNSKFKILFEAVDTSVAKWVYSQHNIKKLISISMGIVIEGTARKAD